MRDDNAWKKVEGAARSYYVYTLANQHDTVLYVEMTSDLRRRVDEHRIGEASQFT